MKYMKNISKKMSFTVLFCLIIWHTSIGQVFRDRNASVDARIESLLNTLTLEEKILLLGFNTPGVERLQIPAYNWWNEALHGIARGGEATVFPQAIAMASTFNPQLIHKVADAISTEARAKYNLSTALGRHLQYMGLNFWTPNINIFRDPRWGRGQETYGEDPFLTATIASAFVSGLQGPAPEKHLKTAACAKHFAVHSGPEAIRHSFNAIVDEKDLKETYLYAFKKLSDNKVEAVMCGYNRLNGEPCCTGETLLKNILRDEWGFKGHVVTDCWALDDIWLRHKVIPTRVEVTATAVKAGVNLDCANILQDDVMEAIKQGMLTPEDVDSALSNTLRTQIKLGLFDKPEDSPYYNYRSDSVNNLYHIALAKKVAEQSMVLLKNNGVLPLNKSEIKSLMVTGTNAASLDALLANYHGISGNMTTFAEGLAAVAGPETAVQYEMGCDYDDTVNFAGIWAAGSMDATVVVIGLTPVLEGEEGDAFQAKSGGDKASLDLPPGHIAFLKKLSASVNKPIIAVVTAGSDIDISAIEEYADAIILAWYPGEQGGSALADIIFGKVSPSGRLPITFYKSLNDLPDYTNYSMQGRTYRYFTGEVEYPFGYGLSYTRFDYSWKMVPAKTYKPADTINFIVNVSNVGSFKSDEVVQAYISYPQIDRMPVKELKAFTRVTINNLEKKQVTLKIPVSELMKWDLSGHTWKLYKGTYTVYVGGDSGGSPINASFNIN
jgi:beta-glucosidase